MSKPGVMIYFDTTPALMRLTLQECGQLFLSILTYAESGVIIGFHEIVCGIRNENLQI